LWWRRRVPVPVLGTMLAVAVAAAVVSRLDPAATGFGLVVPTALLGIVVPVYAVGRHDTHHPGLTWLAASGAGAGSAVALVVRFLQPADLTLDGASPELWPGGAAFVTVVSAAALTLLALPWWLAGLLVARHHARADRQDRVALRDVADRAVRAARGERARIAEGLRAQVLSHTAAMLATADPATDAAAISGANDDDAQSDGAGSVGAGIDGAGSGGPRGDGVASGGAGSRGVAADGAGSDGPRSDGAASDGAGGGGGAGSGGPRGDGVAWGGAGRGGSRSFGGRIDGAGNGGARGGTPDDERIGATLGHARAALTAMRGLLTVLRVSTTTAPRAAQPTLAGLAELCGAEVALEVHGAGEVPLEVQLCAFRVVEAVLPIGAAAGEGPALVRVEHGPDALRLRVRRLAGPVPRPVLAALRERVDAVGGSLATARPDAGRRNGGWQLDASLPVTEVVAS
jgi:hypothetical protein